jgi:eukaryotic-like serine/threonine-protein kinase
VVKVLDFGIARMQDQSAKSPSQTQGIMGTPSFMAPEQARGRWEDVDQRTDLWALGATMFTLLSGRFVHRAETANEALVAAVTQRAPSLATVVSNAHPAIVLLVDKALAYERELRFQNASEFRAALQAADAVIAGDEASPSLRIPKTSATQVTQSGPLGLTTEGVAASVRSAQTNATVLAKQRSKAPLALAAVAAAALLVLVGRGLFAGAGKPSAFASEASASAVPLAPTPASRSAVTVSAAAAASTPSLDPSAAAAAPASELAPAQSTSKAAAKMAHPSAAHNAGATSLSASSAKGHAAKSTADFLKKRH